MSDVNKNKEFKRVIVLNGGGLVVPFIATDCRIALEKNGVIGFDLRIYLDENGEFTGVKDKVVEFFRDFEPDFIFTVDAGVVRNEPEFFDSLGIPVVAWFVDDPFLAMNRNNIIDKFFAFSWDRAFVEPLRELGCAIAEYLPLGTNPARFRRVPPDDPACLPYRCDVSFVGSSLSGNTYRRDRDDIDDAKLKAIFEESIERHSVPPHPPIAELMADIEKRDGVKVNAPNRHAMDFCLAVQSMFLYRNRALGRAARFGPHIYGDEGWRDVVPAGTEYRGPIDYMEDLKYLYSASKVNLNLSKSQLLTSVNQRVFDAPACGGFVLTDYREDAERLFDPDSEIAVFRSYDEMEAKLEYFLGNDAERETRARMTRRRVLSEHTYAHRMKKILETIKDFI